MNKREWMLQAGIAAVGSGENFDDLDMATALSALYDAIVAATPEPADEGWIEHRGEKPYPEGMVDVELRGGVRRQGVDSDELIWKHEDWDGDIIAWRPARA